MHVLPVSHITNSQGERTEPHLQQVIKGEDRAQFELVKYRHWKFEISRTLIRMHGGAGSHNCGGVIDAWLTYDS